MRVSSNTLGCLVAALLLATGGLVLRAGGRLFAMFVAVAFGYLALQAIRNMNLFGLAAGFVLTWNLAGWAADLAAALSVWAATAASFAHSRPRCAGHVGRGPRAADLRDRIRTVLSAYRRAAAVRSARAPLVYAHQAAQFAGRRGLPDRALVFDLGQAAVYLFHNGPQRKVFMDGRLEVPDRTTFATYVRLENMLNEGRLGWAEPVRRMGDPVILLDHKRNSARRPRCLPIPSGAAFTSTL